MSTFLRSIAQDFFEDSSKVWVSSSWCSQAAPFTSQQAQEAETPPDQVFEAACS
jgi:hypothetical protein